MPDEEIVSETPGLPVPGVAFVLRPAVPADTPALVDLAVATEMFLPDEAEFWRGVLDDLHAGRLGADHRVWVWADGPADPPVGGAYFAPNEMGDRVWDLLWISVAPDRQGEGIGGELVRFVEEHVRAVGGRLLVIDTSSLPRFDATHAFYLKHGYAEVARVPDFYADGDSKVIFAKRMALGNGS